VRIWNLFDIPRDALILDAGGGTGRISQAFQQGTNKVIIADQSFSMLEEAKKKAGLLPNCAVTESLPFTESLFDAVIMVDALHHVANPRRSIAELWRVLKPGGRIVPTSIILRSNYWLWLKNRL
jgi:demethylmenaquinone methyltransferase/2-methoxy-6-polyprenyl-1,4-benzoquinol methylase